MVDLSLTLKLILYVFYMCIINMYVKYLIALLYCINIVTRHNDNLYFTITKPYNVYNFHKCFVNLICMLIKHYSKVLKMNL